jgi:hypothetical protein
MTRQGGESRHLGSVSESRAHNPGGGTPSHAVLNSPQHQVLVAADDAPAAVEVGRRCLAIAEGGLGPKHVEVAEELNSLGLLLRQTGHLDEADTLLSRCLHIRETVRLDSDAGLH